MTTSFDELAHRGRGMTRGQRGVVKSRTQPTPEPGPRASAATPGGDIPTSPDPATPASTIVVTPNLTPAPPIRPQPPTVPAGESTTAIGLRLRKTIHNGLADRLHALRVELDRRVTKTELLEMLAWEVGTATVDELAERVDRYRKRAPRRE